MVTGEICIVYIVYIVCSEPNSQPNANHDAGIVTVHNWAIKMRGSSS